jgi:hypothetical protein
MMARREWKIMFDLCDFTLCVFLFGTQPSNKSRNICKLMEDTVMYVYS